MRFEVESIGDVKKRINVEIPSETVASEIEAAYNRLKNQVKIDGFRKGKVPRSVLERYYKGHVEYDVASKLISESFNRALSENELIPVSEPEVEAQPFVAGTPFKYTATVEIKPEVDVRGYEGMRIEKEKVSITDEMVDERVEALRRQNLTLNDVSRALKEGDTAVIDFEGFINGVPFQGGKGEGVPLKIGGGRFIPGFEEQLIGMSQGDEKDITVKFPEDYGHKDLAGKDATFKVGLKGVKEELLPDVCDEFAKDVGYDTLNELKTHIRKEIEKEKAAEVRGKMKDRIVDALIEGNAFDIPPSMLGKQIDLLKDDMKRKYGRAGVDIDKELEKSEVMENLKKAALKQVKGYLLLAAVAKKEGVKVSEKGVDERLSSVAASSNIDVSVVKGYYEKNKLIESLRMEILEDKVFDIIIGKANVVEI